MSNFVTPWVKIDPTDLNQKYPKDPTKEVLVLVGGIEKGYYQLARYSDDEWWVYDNAQEDEKWVELDDVTHWFEVEKPSK